MRAGREEKQMRDVKEQIRVNEIRDAKSLEAVRWSFVIPYREERA